MVRRYVEAHDPGAYLADDLDEGGVIATRARGDPRLGLRRGRVRLALVELRNLDRKMGLGTLVLTNRTIIDALSLAVRALNWPIPSPLKAWMVPKHVRYQAALRPDGRRQ